MKRLLLVLTIALVMAAMVVITAVPAFAARGGVDKTYKPGNYSCFNQLFPTPPVHNIPKGQLANYPEQDGWYCYYNKDIT